MKNIGELLMYLEFKSKENTDDADKADF